MLSGFAQLLLMLLLLLVLRLLWVSQRARYAATVVVASSSTGGGRLVPSSKHQNTYVHPCSKSPTEILINWLDLYTVESAALHGLWCNTRAL